MPTDRSGGDALLVRWLVLHTCSLEHIGPLATGACMAVLQMLAKVIGSEELFCLVAFAELVGMVQMLRADVPLWRVRELVAAIATHIHGATGQRPMIGGFNTSQDGTRP